MVEGGIMVDLEKLCEDFLEYKPNWKIRQPIKGTREDCLRQNAREFLLQYGRDFNTDSRVELLVHYYIRYML